MKLLSEKTVKGRRGFYFPESDFLKQWQAPQLDNEYLCEEAPDLPELSELDVVRHFTELSRRNFGVDNGFYPLGSCTMKYNPRINEELARLPGFTDLHPLQREEDCQGSLRLLFELTTHLCQLTGMDWGTLQPYAGAHGEFTGLKLFQAYFAKKKEDQRKIVLVPDSAHGTNPASAAMAGFTVKEVSSNNQGLISLSAIEPFLNDELAGIMLTNPNTLGLFEKDIIEIARAVHEAGGLLYYDGANFNAVMGKARPGDMGFDVVHLNLHKTFSTPHGGGGPGSGPVLVSQRLRPFLPGPLVEQQAGKYFWQKNLPDSIGRVAGFYGNFGVMIKALAYLLSLGKEGLRRVSELAVLNANYLKEKLKADYDLPYPALCKHEFVLSAANFKDHDIHANDFAKGLLDRGIHPPTVYFPLIVAEAMMIEPNETESKETLDHFIKVMKELAEMARQKPQHLQAAPLSSLVKRVDDVTAARKPLLNWMALEE